MIELYDRASEIDKNTKLNRIFIDLFSAFMFLAFQLDYLITYLGVKTLKYAIEANPLTDIFLNMSQKKAIPIRCIVVLGVVTFINLRMKYYLKQNNIKIIILLLIILSSILVIIFALHSVWIINYIRACIS